MEDERGLTRREALKRAGLLAGAALVGGPALAGCGIGLEDEASAGSGGSKKKAPVLLGIVDSRSGTFAASGASQSITTDILVVGWPSRGCRDEPREDTGRRRRRGRRHRVGVRHWR